jgi:mRNA interferase RelE/StbE
MEWDIFILPHARRLLEKVRDQRMRNLIDKVISKLAYDPDKQGKPMSGKLVGHRSIRAVGQRFRILYRLDRGSVRVLVVMVGLRREGSRDDVYAEAERLFDQGTLDDEA